MSVDRKDYKKNYNQVRTQKKCVIIKRNVRHVIFLSNRSAAGSAAAGKFSRLATAVEKTQ